MGNGATDGAIQNETATTFIEIMLNLLALS